MEWNLCKFCDMYTVSCLKPFGLIPNNDFFQSYYRLKLSKQNVIVKKEGEKIELNVQ